jgi:Helix-loop-helix DNA-binding domain
MADDAALSGIGGAIVKSERKRTRERQRRSDLASAFEELATLVAQIDPEEEDGDTRGKRGRRKSDDPPDVDSMTRLDLIGRTTGVLRRLQRENADLRRRIEDKGLSNDSVRSDSNGDCGW